MDGILKIGDFGLVTDGELGQQHGDSPHTPSHGAGGDTQHTDQVKQVLLNNFETSQTTFSGWYPHLHVSRAATPAALQP